MFIDMLASLRRYRALSPEQRQIIASKQIDGAYTPAALIELLRPMAEFDGHNDRARARGGCLIAILITAALAIAFFVIDLDWRVWSLIGALVAVAIGLGALKYRLAQLDVSDNLRRIALPFLAVLREDMAAGATLQVRIDLHSATHKTKRQPKTPSYKRGPYLKIVDTCYLDPWLSGSARLADGSRLRWEVEDAITLSSRGKRGSSGKYKTKTKHYKRTQLQVVVSLPQNNYQLQGKAAASEARMSVRSSEKWTTVKLSRKLKARDLAPFDVRELINLVSAAYRRVLPAQQEARQ